MIGLCRLGDVENNYSDRLAMPTQADKHQSDCAAVNGLASRQPSSSGPDPSTPRQERQSYLIYVTFCCRYFPLSLSLFSHPPPSSPVFLPCWHISTILCAAGRGWSFMPFVAQIEPYHHRTLFKEKKKTPFR